MCSLLHAFHPISISLLDLYLILNLNSCVVQIVVAVGLALPSADRPSISIDDCERSSDNYLQLCQVSMSHPSCDYNVLACFILWILLS